MNSTAQSNVLLVFPDVPYPLVSGGHLRDWQILNLLHRAGMAPHVLYFGAGESYQLATETPVHTLAVSVTWGGDRVAHPDKSLAKTIERKLSYVLPGQPPTHPMSYQYDAIPAEKAILERAAKTGSDVVIIRSMWCHYAPRLKAAGLRVIANCPDYNTQLAREMVASVSGLSKIGPYANYRGVQRLERQFLPMCDEVWVPTRAEFDAIATYVPSDRLLLMPNLVDVDSLPDLSGEAARGNELLFVANYEYSPNANAARLLLENIFPRVRAACPDATLHLVGRGLPADLVATAKSLDGVKVAGFVDDLIDVYRRAAVVLLPVREGAGMLFKALEALALGKATVGFRKSFRGIEGNGGIVVDTPAEMVERVIELLRDPVRRDEVAKKARQVASDELSWGRGEKIIEASLVCPKMVRS